MFIERTNKEVIIRIPASVDTADIQDVLDFIRYKEITSKFKVPQKTVDVLARAVSKKRKAESKPRPRAK
ncbi:MAG TPA: hypothetical protein VIX80_05950 [Candidatus Kapabacteria bacterium]